MNEPTAPDDLRAWLARIPKTELHLHLEGAIPLDAMWELIQKYGGDPTVPSHEALVERFNFRDFPHFLQMWIWKNRFLREYEDFEYLSTAFAKDLVRQNIRYAEVFFSPVRFVDVGLQTPRLFESIRNGLSSAPDVEVALIGDLVRDYGPDRAMATLKEFEEVKQHGVIGIGIGGSEHKFPPELFTAVYREAREMGFRTTAHAGEAAGPPSVWGAIRELEAERIGHGARSIEDESLVDYLADHQIPLELCPLSNIKTAVFDLIENHPVRRLYDRGVLLTINTDDPMMFGNSLVDDYAALVEVHGFTRDEVKTLILNGVQASWLPSDRKERFVEEFTAEFE